MNELDSQSGRGATTPSRSDDTIGLVTRSSRSTLFGLFDAQARLFPGRIAVEDEQRSLTYDELRRRALKLATVLRRHGATRGQRVAILSENRIEYLELFLAAAAMGVTVACQNWRLSVGEVAHCVDLVSPVVTFASAKHRDKLEHTKVVTYGEEYDQLVAAAEESAVDEAVDPEDALLILYTSGTTGLPKGAVISHRAEIWRGLVMQADLGIAADDTFVAWSPLYHMGAADPSLGALTSGGKVIVVDGFDKRRLASLVASEKLGWLLLMPGMIGAFSDELEARSIAPRSVKLCGVMADLVPPAELARVTRLLDAPYANTFGATETGCPPCSASLIPVGVAPTCLSKEKNPLCEIKLVDSEDREVPLGTPGQLCIRGPTLFSGYFRADEVNREEFRGGWFHMGDVFRQNQNGSFDFVDRVKYLIKSGGENIYPAELERVILQDQRVLDAAVVRRVDEKWGEVPVAFVARSDDSLSENDVIERCRSELASYKRPKAVFFIEMEEFPRSASGKIQRHELEKRLHSGPSA